jgi:hypothetical protein
MASAVTTPAKTAPQLIWLMKIVRTSSSGVTGDRCGMSGFLAIVYSPSVSGDEERQQLTAVPERAPC